MYFSISTFPHRAPKTWFIKAVHPASTYSNTNVAYLNALLGKKNCWQWSQTINKGKNSPTKAACKMSRQSPPLGLLPRNQNPTPGRHSQREYHAAAGSSSPFRQGEPPSSSHFLRGFWMEQGNKGWQATAQVLYLVLRQTQAPAQLALQRLWEFNWII